MTKSDAVNVSLPSRSTAKYVFPIKSPAFATTMAAEMLPPELIREPAELLSKPAPDTLRSVSIFDTKLADETDPLTVAPTVATLTVKPKSVD